MTGALSGLKVLDLSWGVSGPAAAMFLADNGADVTRIERPDPDPFDGFLDYRVYHRGKRSAVFDLKNPSDLETFLRLAAGADVLIESYAPGVTAQLGIDYDTVHALNPRLIYCSITGYGRDTRFSDRPGYDQLVAARTGYQWEVRAWPGSSSDNVAGRDLFGPDTKIPAKERHWFDRNGPVFTSTPAPSISASYLAALGISAALRAREKTGEGQWVETSLMQGVVAYMGSGWFRAEKENGTDPGRPSIMGPIMNFMPGVTVMSGPWSLFECSDGRWVNMWTGRPEWAILAGAGDELKAPSQEDFEAAVAKTGGRNSTLESQLEVRLQAIPIFKKFPQMEWVRVAAEVLQPMQPVRSPEEVRCDPILLEEGAVAVVEDPELGTLHEPGLLYRLFGTPGKVRGPSPKRGAHTDEVKAAAAAPAVAPATGSAQKLTGPLAGVVALDFGLAVAGPWGGELLAQLGAEVIKIDPPRQNMWLSTHMGMKVNRSKRHISLDVKRPEGLEAAYDLVRQADLVLMNMRPQAAKKLGLDYETIKKINPSIVYCRTRGYDDSRAHLPGNDQTGNAVGGTEWEDGGVDRGGRPYWSAASGGDLGNGYMSAIGMCQALYHRDRTGEGQQVDTSILNAAMFSTGRVYTTPDGKRFDRPTVDPDLLGFDALYRLYEASEGWLCLAVFTAREWDALASAIPAVTSFSLSGRADEKLAAVLEEHFRTDTAENWYKVLEQAGVPCEVSSIEFSENFLDDPDMLRLGWAVQREGHPVHGRVDMVGRWVDFSATPTEIGGPPPVPGQHSRQILRRFGWSDERIDGLAAAEAVFEAPSWTA